MSATILSRSPSVRQVFPCPIPPTVFHGAVAAQEEVGVSQLPADGPAEPNSLHGNRLRLNRAYPTDGSKTPRTKRVKAWRPEVGESVPNPLDMVYGAMLKTAKGLLERSPNHAAKGRKDRWSKPRVWAGSGDAAHVKKHTGKAAHGTMEGILNLDAQDLAQSAFLRLLRIGTIPRMGRAGLFTLARRIVGRQFADECRLASSAKRKGMRRLVEAVRDAAMAYVDVLDVLDARLDEQARTIVTRIVQGDSWTTVQESLGVARKTISAALKQAREALAD